MGDFRRDIRLLLNRRDTLRFGALGAFLAVEALLEVAALASVPFFVSLLLASLKGHPSETTGNALGRWLANFQNSSAPSQILWMAGILVLVLNLVRTIWSLLGLRFQYRIQANRRIELSGRLLRCYLLAPSTFHAQRNSSQLLNSVVVECDNVIQGVLAPIFEFIRGGANALFVTVLLLICAPGMTLAAFGMLAISCAGVLGYRNHRLKTLAHREQLGREETLRRGSETLDSRVEATIYGRRHAFLDRFHDAVQGVSQAQTGNMLLQRETWPILEFLSLLALMLVLLVSLMLEKGDLTKVAPQISLLAMALVRLRSNAVNILQNLLQFRRYRPSLQAVSKDIRELESHGRGSNGQIFAEDAVPPYKFDTAISMQGVTFAYPGTQRPALTDISLEVSRGQSIAIVGPTGCGKSTLVRLLLGLETPQQGSIHVDGKPLDAILHSWHHAIGYVPQKPFLLDGTLAENVAFGVPEEDRDAERLSAVLQQAQLSTLLEQLPKGMDEPLGENANRLSGGQAQRVALARALFRNADVLLLDEATSALDTQTAEAFTKALLPLHGKSTILAVTHRLSTLPSFDRILFLMDGRIVSNGSYEHLLRECPLFREFVQSPQILQSSHE